METTNIEGFHVTFYSNDNCIGKQLRENKFWNLDHLDLYKQYYVENKDIIDIGGFIGTDTLLLSKIVSENCKIHTFEPQYYECLQKNVENNNLTPIVCTYEYGLSDICGYISKNNIDKNEEGNYGGKSLAFLHDKDLNEQLIQRNDHSVELRTLDSFAFKNVGLVKIDVEGFEYKVLKGAENTLKNNNFPPVFIEIWDIVCWRNNHKNYYEQNKKDIINFLQELGYEIAFNQNEDYVFIHK